MSWSPPDPRRSPGAPGLAVPARGRDRRWREDVVTCVMTAAVTVLLGAPAGLLWAAIAPHSHVVVAAGTQPYISDAESEVFIAGDGWFLAITLVVGIVTGVLAWLAARRSGPYVVVGLAVGGALAAYVASRVGVRIGQDALTAAVHGGRIGTYVGNVALQTKTVLVAWPLGAVAAFSALVASRVDEID